MKALPAYSIAALFVLLTALSARGDAPPTGQAASSIGDVRIQNLKGYTYAYVSTQTTLNKIQDAISLLMPKMDAAIDSGALWPIGPVVFTYHGVTGQQGKPFTLDIGIIIKDKGTKPDGFTIEQVAPEQCATLLYTGLMAQIGQAYGKLFGELGKRGLQATDVTREVYLYWEGMDSENNIVQIQAALPNALGIKIRDFHNIFGFSTTT